MDPKVIAILSTAFSALIAAFSYLAKTRHERRRATRTVLYYLLELHHLLSRIQFGLKKFPADYVDRCKVALSAKGHVISEAETTALVGHLTQLIRQIGATEVLDLTSEIADPFAKALADLSREDPVLAFELRGKDGIAKASKLLRSLTFASPDDPSVPTGGVAHSPTADLVLAAIDDFTREIAVDELARSIRSVAWRCDAITHFRVLRLLSRAARVNTLADIDAQLSDAIETVVTRIVEVDAGSAKRHVETAAPVEPEQASG